MIPLTGTKKQIEWATKIRHAALSQVRESFDAKIKHPKSTAKGRAKVPKITAQFEGMVSELSKVKDASWWIENRPNVASLKWLAAKHKSLGDAKPAKPAKPAQTAAVKKIVDAAKKNDIEMDRLLAKYDGQIREVIPKIIESIQANQDNVGKLAQAATSARFVRGLLRSVGDPLIAGLEAILADAGAAAIATIRSLPNGEQLARVSRREIKTVLNSNFKEIVRGMASVAKALETTLRSEFLQMALVPKSEEAVALVLADVIGRSIGQARTLVSTAAAKVQRELHTQALEEMGEPDAAVLYIGGVIDSTRPFCEVLDGFAIAVADVEHLRNGQVGDVLTHGGGYNCRHRLLPITLDFAGEEGIPVATPITLDAANDAAGMGR